jgi:DNA polymerase-4
MPRVIFHVDLDAFFVMVERARDPSLTGKPVIVGGLGNRGVVSTASYEARKYGVHSAMPMAQARRLCPQAVYLSPDFDRYLEVSRQFRSIIDGFSPLVEQTSVDEAYMDMTGTERLFGPPEEAARRLKQRVRDEAKVVASVGIASNKLVAKVATNQSKPDGLLMVPAGTEAAFLGPLPVRKLPGLGPRAEEVMKRLGIETLGQLAAYPEGRLRREMGAHAATWLKTRAAGMDEAPVVAEWEAKSISNEITFEKDVQDVRVLLDMLLGLSEKVGSRLRKSGKKARNVQIRVRYSDFSSITRQCTLAAAIDGDAAIYDEARKLVQTALKHRNDPVRLIGVGVAGFDAVAASQLALPGDMEEKDSKVSTAIDAIRGRFGEDAIKRGNASEVRRFVAPFVRQ